MIETIKIPEGVKVFTGKMKFRSGKKYKAPALLKLKSKIDEASKNFDKKKEDGTKKHESIHVKNKIADKAGEKKIDLLKGDAPGGKIDTNSGAGLKGNNRG